MTPKWEEWCLGAGLLGLQSQVLVFSGRDWLEGLLLLTKLEQARIVSAGCPHATPIFCMLGNSRITSQQPIGDVSRKLAVTFDSFPKSSLVHNGECSSIKKGSEHIPRRILLYTAILLSITTEFIQDCKIGGHIDGKVNGGNGRPTCCELCC
jgi:hypothetical protein